MKKQEIPFIFKYLLRWVPGLDLGEEGGVTPVKPAYIEEGVKYTDGIFADYFSIPDISKFDWDDPGVITLVKDQNSDFNGKAIELAKLNYLMYISSDGETEQTNLKLVIVRTSEIMTDIAEEDFIISIMEDKEEARYKKSQLSQNLFWDKYYSEHPATGEGASFVTDQGWTFIAEQYLQLYPKEITFSNFYQYDAWKDIFKTLPDNREFYSINENVRTAMFYMTKRFFFNTKITPDFTKFDFTSEKVMGQEPMWVLPLIATVTSPGKETLDKGLMLVYFEEGKDLPISGGQTLKIPANCYAICQDMEDKIYYMTPEMLQFFKDWYEAAEGSASVPSTIFDEDYKGGWIVEKSEVEFRNIFILYLEQKDVWEDYISIYPFYINQ